LALLYNCPRAATILTIEDSILYVLDRQSFNYLVKDAAIKRRERYESLMSKIELLSTMEDYERTKISDTLKTMKFKKGEVVVKEGDQGNTFYFVESGTAIAYKKNSKGENEKVLSYKEGDYFGELALLKDIPR